MKMYKSMPSQKLTNIGSQNISAIISKFESKSHQIFRNKQTDKLLESKFRAKFEMTGAKTLNCEEEVFYDSFLNMPNGNGNIHSTVGMDVTDSDVKMLRNHPIASRGRRSFANVVSWLVFLLSSVNGAITTTFAIVLLLPKPIITSLIYPVYRLLFGTLYPAYASYKAVRTKNVKEYVKWMMYWIVFALFSCTETFTDIFFSWFPFYYEIKVIIVLWLLSPATKGSSTLYRKFVHPMLTKREQEIDEYISQAKEKGYSAVLQYGSRGVNYATSVIMQTALKGGGTLVSSLKKSYSLSDLSEPDIHRSQDEIDNLTRSQRVLRPRTHSTRSSSSGRNVDMYFSEVDVVDSRQKGGSKDDYKSSEDISSGYSSAEPIPGGLSRTASMTNASKIRLRSKKSEDSDSLEFESLISDPLSIHSKILLSRYPLLREQLQLQHYDERGVGFECDARNDVMPSESLNHRLDNKVFATDEVDATSSAPTNQQLDNKILVTNEVDATKYALFCKWLNESNFQMKNNEKSNVVDSIVTEKDSSDDEFVDTNNDTEQLLPVKEFKEVLPAAILEANESSTIHHTVDQKIDLELETKPNVANSSSIERDHIFEALIKMPSKTNLLEPSNQSLLSLNLSCGSSASDLTSENGNPRRPASHNKGRAPPVPTTVQQISDNISETVSQDKEKTKKNLLTYIPSIFKPITPSISSKNLSKETEI